MLTYIVICLVKKIIQASYYYKLKVNKYWVYLNKLYYIKLPTEKVSNNFRKKANSFFGVDYSLAQYGSY